MILLDIVTIGWCANKLSSKKNKRKDFGRRHNLLNHTYCNKSCDRTCINK